MIKPKFFGHRKSSLKSRAICVFMFFLLAAVIVLWFRMPLSDWNVVKGEIAAPFKQLWHLNFNCLPTLLNFQLKIINVKICRNFFLSFLLAECARTWKRREFKGRVCVRRILFYKHSRGAASSRELFLLFSFAFSAIYIFRFSFVRLLCSVLCV